MDLVRLIVDLDVYEALSQWLYLLTATFRLASGRLSAVASQVAAVPGPVVGTARPDPA